MPLDGEGREPQFGQAFEMEEGEIRPEKALVVLGVHDHIPRPLGPPSGDGDERSCT